MLKTINSGRVANENGKFLEELVEDLLILNNYSKYAGNKKKFLEKVEEAKGKIFCRELIIGNTIYESKRKVDFFLVNRRIFSQNLVIECKWQQTAGSVDEKYPFLLENIKKAKIPTVIILDGNGYKPGARDWLKNQTSYNDYLLEVFNYDDFENWFLKEISTIGILNS